MDKISLLVPLGEKDKAKLVKTPEGGRILWNQDKEEWFWPGNTLPPELETFRYGGKGPVRDYLLTASQTQYREILAQTLPNGRVRWSLPLQKTIWRGTSLPKELLPLAAQPGSQEALYEFFLNREKSPKSKKRKLEIKLSTWDGVALPDELTLLEGQGTLPLERTHWLFPESGERSLKSPFEGKLPPLRIPIPPTFSFRSREACRLVDLVRLTPLCIIHLPEKFNTDPRSTFHCLPELERKYKQPIPLEKFPQVLQSFGILAPLHNFQLHWTPNPEKDHAFLQALVTT